MNFHRTMFFLFVALLTGSGLPGVSVSAAPAARLHWVGLDQVSADTNAASFLKVWQLPETAALVNQTLDKLSRWPTAGATNPASQLLRPLLNDLISSETYVEIYCSTNPQSAIGNPQSAATNRQSAIGNPQFLLALRLPPARATLWQTNLAGVFTALTGKKPETTKSGWQFAATGRYGQVELSRAHGWIVIGVGQGIQALLPSFTARVTSASASPSNTWLEADCDVANLATASPTINHQLSTFNRLSFTVSGSSGQVLTRATVALSHPWTAPLPAWNLPTNLIHESLTSFTVARGFGSWLAGLSVWQRTQLSPAPDQACFWADSGVPFQTYAVVPLPGASNQLARLSARLQQDGNAWLTNHAQGNFTWETNLPGLVWNDCLIINPFLKTTAAGGREALLGGLYPLNPQPGTPPPAAILGALADTPDLVYYQAEQTGVRVDAVLFILQLFRVVLHKPQLPADAAATHWLKQVEPFLGPCTTQVVRNRSDRLTFTRKSTLGLSALELHLLADWLESPQFPVGLHTFLAPPDQ